MRQFTRTVVRNSAFEMAGQLAIKVLSFTFSIFIVRNLGPEAFGQYSAVIAFGSIFAFFADWGLSPYAVREIARMRDQADPFPRIASLWANVLSLRLLLSLATVAMVITTAVLTGRPQMMIIAIALSTIGFFFYAISSASTVVTGFERFDLSARNNVVNQLVFVTLGGVALWIGFGYMGLVFASLAGVATMAWLNVRSARSLGVQLGRPDPSQWLALLRTSFPFGMIGLALGLSYKFDSFLLNITRGDAETGFYAAAYNLVFSTAVLSNVLNTTLYPSLTREVANGSQRLPQIYERALRYLMLMALPIATGASVLADEIIPFLFKANYLPAVPALQIVIWVVPLMYASEFLGYVVLIAGKERDAARSVIVSSSFNVALNLLLVPRFGFIAAAAMTVLTELVLVGQYIWLLRAEIRQLDWRPLARSLIAVLIVSGIAIALRDLPLMLNIAITASVYVGLLFGFRIIGIEEWRLITHIREKPVSK